MYIEEVSWFFIFSIKIKSRESYDHIIFGLNNPRYSIPANFIILEATP